MLCTAVRRCLDLRDGVQLPITIHVFEDVTVELRAEDAVPQEQRSRAQREREEVVVSCCGIGLFDLPTYKYLDLPTYLHNYLALP